MADIQVLTVRVEHLSRSADCWNTAMICAVVLAAIAAILVGIATWKSVTEGKKLAIAQDVLGKAKEANLSLELKDKDRQIATVQRGTAEAKERAAKLEVEALSLKKELLHLGARENLLSGSLRENLVGSLKPFAQQSIEVRYGLSAMGTAQHIPEPAGPDVLGLANSLIKVLQDAQWSVPPVPFVSALQGPPGISIQVSPKASPSTGKAADTLAASLRDVPLGTQGPFPAELSGSPRIGTTRVFIPEVPGGPAAEKSIPAPTDETVILVVLAHPK